MYIHFYAFIYDCVLFNGLTPVYHVASCLKLTKIALLIFLAKFIK